MKVKSDFITNSSSSSFLVLTKGECTQIRLIEIFKELMGTSKLFPNLANDMANSFRQTMERRTLEEWLEDNGYESITDYEDNEDNDNEVRILKEKLGVYPFIYSGYFSDEDGDPIETLLCDAEIDYEDDNIIIYKEGGY
jgi:hypothetical protein